MRSLLPKIGNLRIPCSVYSPDIICVVESWLDVDILDSEISVKTPKRLEKIVPRKIWKYSHADFDAITDCLDTVDWNSLLMDDVDTSWSNWKTCFLHIMDLCIPSSTVKPNRRVPWINHAVLQAIRKRKALFRIFRHSENPLHLANYKIQRNRVVAMLRKCKEEFFHKLNSANVKDFWKAVRKLNKKGTTIPTLYDDDIPVDSSQDKATLLNNFFYCCLNQHCPPSGLPLSSTLL